MSFGISKFRVLSSSGEKTRVKSSSYSHKLVPGNALIKWKADDYFFILNFKNMKYRAFHPIHPRKFHAQQMGINTSLHTNLGSCPGEAHCGGSQECRGCHSLVPGLTIC